MRNETHQSGANPTGGLNGYVIEALWNRLGFGEILREKLRKKKRALEVRASPLGDDGESVV